MNGGEDEQPPHAVREFVSDPTGLIEGPGASNLTPIAVRFRRATSSVFHQRHIGWVPRPKGKPVAIGDEIDRETRLQSFA
jgi:hypothetical protein